MEVDLDEYFEKTYQEKLPPKQPGKKDDVTSPPVEMLKRRQEMIEVEEDLLNRKKEFENKMESLKEQKESIDKKQIQLKEYLHKFEKFLRENEAKRVRAKKRATKEIEARKAKEKEIEKLEFDVKLLQDQKKVYQKKLDETRCFMRSLENIIESTEEFSEIRDVTSRYDTLVGSQLDLLTREQDILKAIEVEKIRTAESVTAKDNEILHYNNLLANLQGKLDKAQSNLTKWESKWIRIQNTATEKALTLGKMKIATHNIFQLVTKNSKFLGDVPPENIQLQLEKIQVFLQDSTFVVNELKKGSEITF